MILDSPIMVNLGQGAPGRTVEMGDAQITVPPVLFPTLDFSGQLIALNVGNPVLEQSTIKRDTLNVTNQAATSNTVATLVKGLWEIDVCLSAWYNFVTVGGLVLGASVELLYQTIQAPALVQFAVIGTQVTTFKWRFLLASNMLVIHSVGITAAGQTINSSVFFNFNKLL